MGEHINEDGKFQSDKYPTCPAGKVPLSTKDPMAQDLLWAYAQRRRAVDASFADDLETCLRADGFNVTTDHVRRCQELLKSLSVPADDEGVFTFLMFASEADRKAYEEALRARGEALPKGTVLTP